MSPNFISFETFKLENDTMRKGVVSDQARKRDGVRSISVNYMPKGTFVPSVYVLKFLTTPSIALCSFELFLSMGHVGMSEVSWKLEGEKLAYEAIPDSTGNFSSSICPLQSLYFIFFFFRRMTTLLFQIELTLFYLKEFMLFWHFECWLYYALHY